MSPQAPEHDDFGSLSLSTELPWCGEIKLFKFHLLSQIHRACVCLVRLEKLRSVGTSPGVSACATAEPSHQEVLDLLSNRLTLLLSFCLSASTT